eukprot:6272897-Pyramimonas_sp.AAC.1
MRELFTRLGEKRTKLGTDKLDVYFGHWAWPSAYASAKDLCRDGNGPSGSASEFLSAAQLIAKFLRDVALKNPAVVEHYLAEVRSALALCDVMELLMVIHSGAVTAGQLGNAIVHHLKLHQEAYQLSLWKPKAHMALHLPRQLALHKCLLSTFLLERKHRLLKRFASDRCTLTSFGRGLMEETTVQHLFDLKDPLGKDFLVDPIPPKP